MTGCTPTSSSDSATSRTTAAARRARKTERVPCSPAFGVRRVQRHSDRRLLDSCNEYVRLRYGCQSPRQFGGRRVESKVANRLLTLLGEVLHGTFECFFNYPNVLSSDFLELEIVPAVVVDPVHRGGTSIDFEVRLGGWCSRCVPHPRAERTRREFEGAVVLSFRLPPGRESRWLRELHNAVAFSPARCRADWASSCRHRVFHQGLAPSADPFLHVIREGVGCGLHVGPDGEVVHDPRRTSEAGRL